MSLTAPTPNPPSLDAAPQTKLAQDVVARMLAMGENIRHLLLQFEEARDALSRLRERRAVLQRSLERPLVGSAAEQALEAARRELGAAELKASLGELTLRCESLGEQLATAQGELQQLQTDTLPAAQVTDLIADFERAEGERRQLQTDVELQQQNLRQVSRGEPTPAVEAQRSAARQQGLRMPVSETALLSEAAGLRSESAGPPEGLPHTQVQPLVDDVGNILRAAAEVPAKDGPQPLDAATARLQSRWASTLTGMPEGLDVSTLIQYVIREAYLGNSEDLKSYAYRVQFYTKLKKNLRDELAKVRQFASQNIRSDDPTKLKQPYTKKRFSSVGRLDNDGVLQPEEPSDAGEATDVRQLEDYIKELDNQLNTVGDDSQMAQLELQNMTQRQQQTLQTLSNLSKMFHETSMAIIRKIGN